MSRENETSNSIIPDFRKGYIQLLNEDDLLHFQWKERNATEAEDDLIIFPDDAKLVRVSEAGDDRVYMLRFESSKAKHFFWMQVRFLFDFFFIFRILTVFRINQIREILGSLKELML
jgi:hypothetical protein